MNHDLKILENYFGKEFANLCQELFPQILKEKGLLSKIILDAFASDRSFYEEINTSSKKESFKNYINHKIDMMDVVKRKDIRATDELFLKMGYTLYECKTKDDIKEFLKYFVSLYRNVEDFERMLRNFEKCLNSGRIFFALTPNANLLEYNEKSNKKEYNEYKNSVIFIHIDNIESELRIFNRLFDFTGDNSRLLKAIISFAHTINDNFDSIILGQSRKSFEKYYGKTPKFRLSNYRLGNDGKYYKYYHEHYSDYFCAHNVIVDRYGNITKLPIDRYMIIDHFLLDLKEKVLLTYNPTALEESFLKTIPKIDKIEINELEDGKKITLSNINQGDVIITINQNHRMVGLVNNNITKIDDDFLMFADKLQFFVAKNVEKIGQGFLLWNKDLKILDAPKLEMLGDNSLEFNDSLEILVFSNLKAMGKNILSRNKNFKMLIAPKLEKMGENTLKHSDSVIIYSPKLQKKLPKNHKLYNRFYKKEYEGLSSKKITEIIMQEKSIEVHEKTKGKTLVKRR